MPFDGSGYRPVPIPPEPPRRPGMQENVLTVLAAGFVLLMFLLPISAGTLVAIVRAAFGPG